MKVIQRSGITVKSRIKESGHSDVRNSPDVKDRRLGGRCELYIRHITNSVELSTTREIPSCLDTR
jgi:hypothetical protein